MLTTTTMAHRRLSPACLAPPPPEERVKVDDIRGSPMSVGTLEEVIDDNHAIVSSAVGPEYYVNILSFVDKDELEPGCTVLLHNKVSPKARPQTVQR